MGTRILQWKQAALHGAAAGLAGLLAVAALPAQAAGDAWLSAIDAGRSGAAQQKAEPRHVEVKLIAENAALTPQAVNRLAVVFEHEKGWHTYWKNPGEAGFPPAFTFRMPSGFKATDPAFPLPERLVSGGITSFGYGGTTSFPFRVEIPRSAGTTGSATIRLHVEYLACKDMCVPEEADVKLTLPLRVSSKPSADAPRIEDALKRIPEVRPAAPSLTAVIEGERLRIDETSGLLVKNSLDFFPEIKDAVDLREAPVFEITERDGGTVSSLYLKATQAFAKAPAQGLNGVLVADGGPMKGGWAIDTDIALSQGAVGAPRQARRVVTIDSASAKPAPVAAQELTTWTAAGFALLGGLILNLMPCVFPVLSLKLLQLVSGAQKGERLMAHGAAFTAGTLATMTALSGLLIALRSMGDALGWGFQLQSPWVVGALLLLFGAITLNLLGVFEFTMGSRVADAKLVRQAPQTGIASSFLTGVLAVVVASPCTAPFMGAALGFALTQPALSAMAVFLSLGLGMALPWLLLCLFPAWAKKLPKPGPWMDVFRKIMAVPMAAAELWLAWVLSKQIDFIGLLVVLCGLAAMCVFFWLLGREQWGLGRNRLVMAAMAVIAVGAVAAAGSERFAAQGVEIEADSGWQPWSEQAVADALSQGKPVFVDFTAAWCVTCQANKLAALDREEVIRRFNELGYVRLLGDWTNRNAEIAAVLEKFDRSGVPLYLIYRPDGRVEVLPELLTPSIVLDAIGKP